MKAAILEVKKNTADELVLRTRSHGDDETASEKKELSPELQGKSTGFLSYLPYGPSDDLDNMTFGVLKELCRLQAKGKDQPVEKRYKYKKYVLGFREVQRCLKRRELKGIIVATNLDSVDELVSSLQGLEGECTALEVPLIYSLTRRRMGKAVGRSMKQSLVGIVNLEGVHQPWKQILSLVDSIPPISGSGPSIPNDP